MLSILLYLVVICSSAILFEYLARNKQAIIIYASGRKELPAKAAWTAVIISLLCMAPVFLLFSLREGIGTDYSSYEMTFNVLHKTKFLEYLSLHHAGENIYYVELGYYFLNRIAPSYRILIVLDAFFMYIPVVKAISLYRFRHSFGFSIFIFLATQFIYSMNGIRFAIALSFILLAFVHLLNNNHKHFFICVVSAAMFHTTAWITLLYFLVREFRSKKLNQVRNILMLIIVLGFPQLCNTLLSAATLFPVFDRYFSRSAYSISAEMRMSYTWLLHIVPVIFPIWFVLRRQMLESGEEKVMFRIYATEIPLRMLGLYNTWFTRLARIPQLIQVIFIPHMLNKVKRSQDRKILFIYYVVWYVFYFIYYILVNDSGDSIPYQWIFG